MYSNFSLVFGGILYTLAAGLAAGTSVGLKDAKARATSQPAPGDWYYGKGNLEAQVRFAHQVEFQADQEPDEDLAMAKIDAQVAHLYGSMENAAHRAGPKDDYQIWDIEVSPKPGQAQTWIAKYVYEGTFVLSSRFSGSTYEAFLPVNPDLVWSQAGGYGNQCTDGAHREPGEFYYFFNPTRRGCRLKEGREYLRAKIDVTRIDNTVRTYPEYARLVGPGNVLRVDVMMGLNDERNKWDPDRSGDVNAPEYRQIRNRLKSLGYRGRRLPPAEAAALGHVEVKDAPYIEEFTRDTPRGKLLVRMFFGPSSFDGGYATPFHYLLKDALENASVVIYGGHSGLGANADLPQIEQAHDFKIQLPLDRYQIYLFNSCSSYTAYVTGFFRRKATAADPAGRRNLEVLGTGLVSYFADMGDMNAGFIQQLTEWARDGKARSYQEIVNALDRNNFFSVSGDEDNPSAP